MSPGWPARLRSGEVVVRPLSSADRRAWRDVRRRNAEWLRPWDPTAPPGASARPTTYGGMVRAMLRGARDGRQLPFAVEFRGEFIGQVTVNNIVRGSAQFASIGYWVDGRHAGHGLIPRAVALVIDHCFGPVGLHRIEVCIRPENVASLRVVDKLGIAQIGYAPRFLHIDGDWRDHLVFAVTKEEVPGGLLARLDAREAARSPSSTSVITPPAAHLESHQSQE